MMVDPRELAATLLDCVHVRALHSGPLGAITSYPATGPVHGVLIGPAMILLGLVVGPGVDRDHLALRVREHLALLAPGVPVTLSIVAIGPRP